MSIEAELVGEIVRQALDDLAGWGVEVDTARSFLLGPDSPLPELAEPLGLDLDWIEREALHRSARLEALYANQAARNRSRAKERTVA